MFYLLKPSFKSCLWGGSKLKKEFNYKNTPPIAAEAWILSTYPESNSYITNGAYKNMPLSYMLKKNPFAAGSLSNKYNHFPILIKLIDAAESLSVQVHPNDDYALKNENEYGKTEGWYILDAEKMQK